eukprot:1160428-Pelagomonas_calceolata.AAC.1
MCTLPGRLCPNPTNAVHPLCQSVFFTLQSMRIVPCAPGVPSPGEMAPRLPPLQTPLALPGFDFSRLGQQLG